MQEHFKTLGVHHSDVEIKRSDPSAFISVGADR
ncbi:hypothetical protein TH47_21130 [Thalassospira sp. MCCC 1A02803]|nr:hypothetical protein TH47_21130 [Thalassospira sp. MCCC 1A02803]